MPLVTVKQKFQITLPASIRKDIHIDVGDLMEASICEQGILLKPKMLTDRQSKVSKMTQILSAPVPDDAVAGMSDDEIMEEAITIVKDIRKNKSAKSSKS